MQYFIVIVAAFALGCIAAVPAGPVQIEVIRRSINGHLKPSLMVVTGAFVVDVAYGVIALFGIAPFLKEERVMALFWLSGGIILAVLSIIILKHSGAERGNAPPPRHLRKKRWAFIGGISLSVTNPVMILWWLSGVRIFLDVGLIRELTPDMALSFLAAGSVGLASYLSALSVFLYWAKKFVSPKTIQRINRSFGIFLLGISCYFIFTSLRLLLR
ncbi:MAG: LysE family transporter [Nitrospiraceae bacterium]|nr:LysE family transporter [Nitrospiraceae bacterium]